MNESFVAEKGRFALSVATVAGADGKPVRWLKLTNGDEAMAFRLNDVADLHSVAWSMLDHIENGG